MQLYDALKNPGIEMRGIQNLGVWLCIMEGRMHIASRRLTPPAATPPPHATSSPGPATEMVAFSGDPHGCNIVFLDFIRPLLLFYLVAVGLSPGPGDPIPRASDRSASGQVDAFQEKKLLY
jgi:hypothetical protein